MRYSTLLGRAIALAIVAAPVAGAQARSTQSAGGAPANASAKPDVKTLQLEDFARWNRITSPALSPDGKWMTFTYSPNEGGQTILHVKALDGSKDYTAIVGGGAGGGRAGGGGGRGGAGGGNAPSFTDDSKWAAYMVTPQGRGGGAAGRAGRGRAGGATATDESTTPHLELLNLATGEKVAIPNAASWKFSNDGRWLAVKLNRPAAAPAADAPAASGRGGRGGGGGAASPGGADLVMRDMSTGARTQHRQRQPIRVRQRR